jgi:hypothetical protein
MIVRFEQQQTCELFYVLLNKCIPYCELARNFLVLIKSRITVKTLSTINEKTKSTLGQIK